MDKNDSQEGEGGSARKSIHTPFRSSPMPDTIKTKKKTDIWKVVSIILIVVAVALIVYSFVEKAQNKKMAEIQGFEIPEKQFKEMIDLAEDEKWNQFIIVNLETNGSVKFMRNTKI